MKAYLTYKISKENPVITIPGSKSESNRLLILKAIFPNLKINNLSNSDDTLNLKKGITVKKGIVDVHHAGTAMRFLTAYFAFKEGVEITLTGSQRMQERPIKILVAALRSLGANIQYVNKEGFPPIKIIGTQLLQNSVSLHANVSSQYISALMLVAPSLSNGLQINLIGKVTSVPYINMTMDLLKKVGVSANFSNNKIVIQPLKTIPPLTVAVESDWSSASYYYSLVALSEDRRVTLKNYSRNSMQGDSEVASIFEKLGVETVFNASNNSIQLKKHVKPVSESLHLNLNKTPDIAQTIVVTCFGMGIHCKLEGLKTLKIKETDRLLALKTELEKLGASVVIDNESIEVFPLEKINKNKVIETYQDHRMAMAFAPLVLKIPLAIKKPEVVTKSYASFWEDFHKMGIHKQIK